MNCMDCRNFKAKIRLDLGTIVFLDGAYCAKGLRKDKYGDIYFSIRREALHSLQKIKELTFCNFFDSMED